ncbi:MAG: UbiX family flavin prenyltransferase [Candidatus Gastranaerophilales bacterium]|nr:UbiX family flavin prenyltransferase [Candidatus Gastranaerophilales bacterium]
MYGVKVLEFLLKNNYKVELIISSKAYGIIKQEIELELEHNAETIRKNLLEYLDIDGKDHLKVWLDNDMWANPASGSYKTSGMIVAPASMATVAAIAAGYAENLITRAADVCLKEKRPLTLVPRETPVSPIHLENMLKLSRLGVNIVLPAPGFYHKPKTVDDIINFVTGKILDACKIDNNLYERWQQ